MLEQVSEIEWGLVIECFKGEEEDFELGTLFNREPVEILMDGG